jgi:predicted nucleotidyltransferase
MIKNELLNLLRTRSPATSWIGDRTIFLTLHGSRAYGTNTEESDYDYRGITIPTKEYYLGTKHFEQMELKAPEPDTVVYEIRKTFELAANCNPNVLEFLHTDPSDHVFVHPLGQMILDHKDDFLSKRVKYTLLGYSMSQMKRMALHRGWLLNKPTHPPTRKEFGLPEQTLIPADQLAAASAEIQKDLDRHNFDMIENLTEDQKIGLRAIMADMLATLKISTEDKWLSSARTVGLGDNFIELMQKERQYSSAKKNWDSFCAWQNSRNPARKAMEDKFGLNTKNAMHLVRLIRMAKELLTTGKIIVKRPDAEELLAIKNGAMTYQELMEYAEKEEREIEDLYKTSTILPHSPNRGKLDALCLDIVERALYGGELYSR